MVLASSVLLASLVGSPHCAGMCGGLAAFCSGAGQCGGRASAWAGSVYHLSRLLSYILVGVIAGTTGAAIESGGAFIGIQRTAAVAAGIAVIAVGLSMLVTAAGVTTNSSRVPPFLQRAVVAVHRTASLMPPVRRALLVGIATPLLPCGWLWAFAVVAAGTGSAAAGALVMAAFWLGTVPVLAIVGASVAAIPANHRRWMSGLAGALMVAVGTHAAVVRASTAQSVSAAVGKMSSQPASLESIASDPPSCCRASESGGEP